MDKTTSFLKTPKQTPSSDGSTDSNYSTSHSNEDISLIDEFDDIVSGFHQQVKLRSEAENVLATFVEECLLLYNHYFAALDECQRLQNVVDEKTQEKSELEHLLVKARKLFDHEKQHVRRVLQERDDLANQLHQVRDFLFTDKESINRLPEEIRRILSQVGAVRETNSTGSILSDFSYSRSEDDLDGSCIQAGKAWKKHRPSTGEVAEPPTKKRRSSLNKIVEIQTGDTVRATTTVSVSKERPITASLIIESVSKPSAPPAGNANPSATADLKSVSPISAPPACDALSPDGTLHDKNVQLRTHTFHQKMILIPTTCVACEKRISIGRTIVKCKECSSVCHVECKERFPVPCIPSMNTPTQNNGPGSISDYTPTNPPMVPSLLIHCINEIELRGLTEVGLYRRAGAEHDVKSLKEKFMKGKTAPCLNSIDVHVICGVVKSFLRSLREPIVTYGLRAKFVQAVQSADILQGLYQVIAELPQANRDTLAYLILHLQKVSRSKECKMHCGNLAKCFGPTIVGYTSDDPNPDFWMEEVTKLNIVMEHLLNIPSDYWASFVNVETTKLGSRLQQTPSINSLLSRTTSQSLFRTPRNPDLLKRKQKFFHLD